MKNIILFIYLLFISSLSLAGNGGMLIPSVLEAFESDMKAKGMKISTEDIYSINHSSIKDAIIHFGGGCTGTIISDHGLLLTNYHCGYYQVYAHSTVENNIAANGFWSKSFEKELPNSGLTATRMVRIQEVTQQVLEGTDGLEPAGKYLKISTNIARIKAAATQGTYFQASVKPFDFGNSYFLLVKEVFKDVRLVAAPPETIGKFGGDKDNWVWPRQTGDFSLFRIYVNQNNEPAEFSKNNVPYTPKYFLPISIQPREIGEFVMIFGYPGRTYQHTISAKLSFLLYQLRPAQIKMRGFVVKAMDEGMRKSKTIKINYSAKQARVANGWKKWQGQIKGLKMKGVLAQKIQHEHSYTQKAESKPEWKSSYGKIVAKLNQLTNTYKKENFVYQMFVEYTYVGAELFDRAEAVQKLMDLYNKGKIEDLKEEIKSQKESLDHFYSKYNSTIDKKIFLLQTQFYKQKVASFFLPPLLLENSSKELQEEIYSNSFLVHQKEYKKMLNNFKSYAKNKINKDIGYRLFQELNAVLKEKILFNLRTYYATKEFLLKQYVKGKYEMYPEAKHWPNANNTLRLSYGKLEGSSPRDGIKYKPYTTLKGVIEKYNTGKKVYKIPPRLLKLYQNRKFGDYAQDGKLWVCFLSSLHTAGGNSGSPIIDGNGYLIGVNFDRTWESTMSDYKFDPSICRNISVDIRYVLWLIDVYGQNERLIKEMTIIK